MHENLIEQITSSGFKKSKIESDLGMPRNCLSGMMKGRKSTSEKWAKRLEEYLENNGEIKKFNILLSPDTNGRFVLSDGKVEIRGNLEWDKSLDEIFKEREVVEIIQSNKEKEKPVVNIDNDRIVKIREMLSLSSTMLPSSKRRILQKELDDLLK